jgi:hypothetical protein
LEPGGVPLRAVGIIQSAGLFVTVDMNGAFNAWDRQLRRYEVRSPYGGVRSVLYLSDCLAVSLGGTLAVLTTTG